MMRIPTYLEKTSAVPDLHGPSSQLSDGKWCGHGEPDYVVADIVFEATSHFQVYLPVSGPSSPLTVPSIAVQPINRTERFLIYIPRQHPASIFAWRDNPRLEPYFRDPYACPACNHTVFRVAVGFEYPSDSHDVNDTSWFALAVQCTGCSEKRLIFDDETA